MFAIFTYLVACWHHANEMAALRSDLEFVFQISKVGNYENSRNKLFGSKTSKFFMYVPIEMCWVRKSTHIFVDIKKIYSDSNLFDVHTYVSYYYFVVQNRSNFNAHDWLNKNKCVRGIKHTLCTNAFTLFHLRTYVRK